MAIERERWSGEAVACEWLAPLLDTLHASSFHKLRRKAPIALIVSLAEERELLEAISPSWLGIRYEPVDAIDLARLGVQRGAVRVTEVISGSPAAGAEIQQGDVLTGPPGDPFVEPHAVREFVMRSPVAEPFPMQLRRDGRALEVMLTLEPYPLAVPKSKRTPKAGEGAPRSRTHEP
jgi:C-terminal processing protease CtpA/Prc